jgi:hypothetical protein
MREFAIKAHRADMDVGSADQAGLLFQAIARFDEIGFGIVVEAIAHFAR